MAKQELDRRPNPDALLAAAGSASKGKLTAFLGAAPGVGKTFRCWAAPSDSVPLPDAADRIVERRIHPVMTQSPEVSSSQRHRALARTAGGDRGGRLQDRQSRLNAPDENRTVTSQRPRRGRRQRPSAVNFLDRREGRKRTSVDHVGRRRSATLSMDISLLDELDLHSCGTDAARVPLHGNNRPRQSSSRSCAGAGHVIDRRHPQGCSV
jgi:hypothetical protein